MASAGVVALALGLVFAGEAQVAGGASDGLRFVFDAWRCGSSVHSAWRQGDGNMVAAEELDLEGEQWVRYRLHRPNVAQDVVAVRSGRIVNLTIRQGGSTRRVTLQTGAELLAGPALVNHIATSLPQLRAGEPLEFDYLIPEEAMILRLRASLAQPAAVADPAVITAVRIQAASVLLRPFVPMTTLVFGVDGDLRSLTGRLLPVSANAKKLKSLDGVLRIRPVHLAAREPRMKPVCNNPSLS